MGIVSYAQNFEDVMLWRALSHVEQGSYIDIGAQDPLFDSVSLAFHERGWRGIHVEPTPSYAEALREARPGDTVIQAAVGKGPAVIPFFEIPGTGISTGDPAIAEQHRQRGFNVEEITVPCLPLSAILEAQPDQDVHWLKIDVEGFELQVLGTWGTCPVRPWIVVVESTLPSTQIDTHANWEALLLERGYAPVYFDALNRYYVSDAHPELKDAFLVPPNIFDGFRLNGTSSGPFHELLEERFNSRMRETRAEFEQRERSEDLEIERLTLELASQEAASGECEKTLSEQLLAVQQELRDLERDRTQHEKEHANLISDAQQQLGASLRKLAQREQEVGAQLLDIQQRAHQQNAEQDRIHSERSHALHREHIERERFFAQQLLSAQQDLRRLEQDRAQREKEHATLIHDAQQQLGASLRTLTQREQEVGAQLLDIQQRAHQQNAEQDRIHSERSHALHREHIERERFFAQQLLSAQQDLRRLEQDRAQREKEHATLISDGQQQLEASLRTLAQREQELGAQLLSIQQSAEMKMAEEVRRHSDEVRTLVWQHREAGHSLQLEHGVRERALTDQVAALQLELKNQIRVWSDREAALQGTIREIKREADDLVSAREQLILNYQLESSDTRKKYKDLLESSSELEATLKNQLAAEQHDNQELERSLDQLRDEILEIHNSLSWRITTPLRRFEFRQAGRARSLQTVLPQMTPVPTISTNQETSNTITSPVTDRSDMPSFTNTLDRRTTTSAPTTIKELLARCDSDFIYHAYQTVLNRNPDPEGFSYYLDRVRSGISKIEVLSQLRQSKEGQNATPRLVDIDQVVVSYSKQRIPIIGFLYRVFTGSGRMRIIERQLSALENRLALMDEHSNERFSRLEQRLSSLEILTAQHTQSLLNAIANNPTSAELENSLQTPAIPLPKELEGLSPTSKRIYRSLKVAITNHSLQHEKH